MSNRLPRIQLEEVSTYRKNRQGQVDLFLDAISFTAYQGEITAIIGPSGGGKSSVLRLINRLDDPVQGRILLDGTDISAMHPPLLRRNICMMLQKAYMFAGTVLDNLQQPFRYRNEPLPAADNPELLRCLELARLRPEFLARDARTLSGGEQQRVNLARALLSKPRALLLDEPTSALDRPTADQLVSTVQAVCRTEQLAVIMVTHDLRLAGRITDQLIYLEEGRILETGDTLLLEKPRTEALRRFLEEPAVQEDEQR